MEQFTSKKMKILHITGSMSIGGAQRLLLGLLRHTNRDLFDIHLYYFGKIKEDSFIPDLRALKDIVIVFKPAKYFYDPRFVIRIVKYIKENQIDLVQTHLINADIIGRVAGFIAGVPVISTLQNEPRNYENQRFDRRWLARLTARYLTTYSVAVSDHIRELFISNWKISSQKIGVVYNAVAMEEFLEIPEGKRNSEVYIDFRITNIASLTPQKAQHILIEAARNILEKHPYVKFLIVGTGNLEDRLKRLVESYKISSNVIFTGIRRDIPEILRTTDIFVLSSFWEGLPLAAIEAMAAARPVILTDVGGNTELVKSGVNGLIVPPNNVDKLTEAMLNLVENEEARYKLGRHARVIARDRFRIETITTKYENLYQSIVNR